MNLRDLLLTIMLLFTSTLHAVSADFFGTVTAAGENSFRSTITSANASAVFFEHHFTSSTTAANLSPVAVTGSDGSTVYVKISRNSSTNAYSAPVTHSHDGYPTYYMDDWTVDVTQTSSGWNEAVSEGVKFEFFSDLAMTTQATINAFGTFTYHWGTCCVDGPNPTPTGTSTGTALYSVFTTSAGISSTNQIGNIETEISIDVHFVGEIDDSDLFTSVTLVPNGDGEVFYIGGYLLFSTVGVGTIPAGSGWTPDITPSVAFNPVNGATGIGVGSNITLTFTEAVRNTDDSDLTDSNVDALITLKTNNSSGTAIPFDATINSTKTVITINPTSDFTSNMVVYVAIGATVEDSDNNTLTASNATFTCAASNVPTAVFNPTDGSTGVSLNTDITITFNEAVRNTDNSDITDSNVDALITLKKTNSSGAVIPFDATINTAKTVITINPTSDFSSNLVVYAGIASVEGVSNNATAPSNVTFTCGAASSVPTAVFNPTDGSTGVLLNTDITITFNEAVRNTDNSDITDSNVDALITLKKTNSSGDAIPFDATINTAKTVITINPTSDFSSNLVVYAGIASVEDVSDNATTALNVTFTTTDNIAPVVTDIPDETILEGGSFSTISLDNYVSDAGTADSLINWVSTGQTSLTVTITNRVAFITAASTNWNGSEVVTFIAINNNALTGSNAATFTVTPVNDAPVFSSTAITVTTENVTFSYTATASDIDGDAMTFAAPTLPAWLSFNGTAMISGTPLTSGSYDVVLTVNDGTVTVEQSFTITVTEANDAPVFTSTPITVATEDVLYSYTVTASDEEGNTLTYAATTLPTWLSFNNSTQVLNGTPLNAHVGINTVVLTVSDGTVEVEQSFTITAENVNDTPSSFSLISPEDENLIVLTNNNLSDTLWFNWSESMDIDGDILSYTFEFSDEIAILIEHTTSDQTYGITYSFFAEAMDTLTTLTGNWFVSVTDSFETLTADNGPFTLTIDKSALAINPRGLIVEDFVLHQNYPNPFNPATTISFSVPEFGLTTIKVYDLTGRELATLTNEFLNSGSYSINWEASSHPSGVYFVKMETDKFSKTQMVVLIK